MHLKALSMHLDCINDRTLQAIAGQKDLISLNLDGNSDLTDKGVLEATKQMPRLRTLNLKGTSVSPAVIASLKKRVPNCQVLLGSSREAAGIEKKDINMFNGF
jgi:hypothetical protein